MEKLEDYEIETVKKIRSLGSKFNNMTDEQIVDEYGNWSDKEYFAGWMNGCEEEFYFQFKGESNAR
jgi:hypothetical protein